MRSWKRFGQLTGGRTEIIGRGNSPKASREVRGSVARLREIADDGPYRSRARIRPHDRNLSASREPSGTR
jgi:hypothetical protein